MSFKALITGFFLALITPGIAQSEGVWIHPNAGQWDDRIEHKVEIQTGEIYIEKNGFVFYLNDAKQRLEHLHESPGTSIDSFGVHVIRAVFDNSTWSGVTESTVESGFYRNYILNNDASTWKSHVKSYQHVVMKEFYQGIDLVLDGSRDVLEYSLIAQPNSAISEVALTFFGSDGLYLNESGDLVIVNRFGVITMSKPKAWQEGSDIAVEFKQSNGRVEFYFPQGYDESKELVIDPNIVFSTFSGSTADNWGMSATPDANGNLIGGGTVFGLGYPITSGAYDASFNMGNIDVGVTKFNATGTALIYSTYIGGSGSESPNSMICNSNGDLYIYGLTSSANFPMAGSPYDNSFAGGPNISSMTFSMGFAEGTDLYVAKLSADGSSLLASTFVGGSDTDGFNSGGAGTLNYNYGDTFRGEIVLDDNENVYVTSSSRSSNFPVLGSASTLSGTQDAVIFKLNSNLSSLIWSRFFGGSGLETGNSLKVADNGNVYVVGGTTAGGLNFTQGHNLVYGGAIDGYAIRLSGVNGQLLSGTYIGQAEYQQAYSVQVDHEGGVYVLGQSESDMGITPSHYGNANAGQFLRKYNSQLTNLAWTTTIGAGIGHVEISPTAFLVSNCKDIYIAGWGGNLNQNLGQASFSSTNGFPVTFDAYQSTTSGSNFYICVLDEDAMNLKYGTFIGGLSSSYNHVDGGTSRFDSLGRIYHAVCGACGGNPTGFSTTPGVWSPTNQSANCNLAAFKFELSTIDPLIATPNNVVCIPDPVIFNNNTANGNAFFWDFGDGSTSTDVNPSHYYTSPGTYTVTLVVSDTNGCFSPDSVTMEVFIGDYVATVDPPTGPICPGDSYQLEAYGGSNYIWSPAQYLDDPNISNPIATIDQTTEFTVIVSDTCGVDTVTVILEVYDPPHSIINDTVVCLGSGIGLYATGGVSYLWNPATYLDDPNSATPFCLPDQTITYFVEIESSEGCIMKDTVTVTVELTPPNPQIPDTISICEGSSTVITVSGATYYQWLPNTTITPVIGPTVTVNPMVDTWYYCNFLNACGGMMDSVFVEVIEAQIEAGNDTIICLGESAQLWASGGISYLWSPANSLNANNLSMVTATPTEPTIYVVTGTDVNGCVNWDTVFVDLHPFAFIQTSPDVYAFLGDEIELSATSTTSGQYIWFPPEFLSCVACTNPIANPDQEYFYVVSYTDQNGCSASDTVFIHYDPIIYVPNTFTPNGEDGMNPIFLAVGGNFKSFEMTVFDRWGELIFTSNDITIGWDGTYQGAICQDGTYIWKIKISDLQDEDHHFVGHVNLLR